MMFSLTKNFVLVSLALFVCGNVAVAQETILFYDNFESDGTDPGQDPVIGAGDIGGNWVIFEQVAGLDDGVQVENDPLIADPQITGNNFLHITRTDRWTRKGFAMGTGWDIAPTMQPGALVTFSYSLYMPSDADAEAEARSSTFLSGLVDPFNFSEVDEYGSGFSVYGDGHVRDIRNHTAGVETLTAALDQWEEVSISYRHDYQVYDLTVGSSTVTDIPFWDRFPLPTFIQWFYLAASADGTHYYLDNVQLSVTGSVPPTFPDGDFDASNLVGLSDLNLVLFNWGGPGGSLPSDWSHQIPTGNVGIDQLNGVLFNWGASSLAAIVPEPASLPLLMGMLTIGMLSCRARIRNRIYLVT